MEHRAIAAIRNTVAEHALIEEGMQIVVGLSGGPDSSCLFHALASLRGALRFGLSAVHVNHGLRPGDAERDARFAAELCRASDAPFFACARDVRALARARGLGAEEAGRAARYEVFRETAARIAAEKALPPARVRIAVAHNKNDQAETVLMRILRGTGPHGLAAMPYRREDAGGFVLIRPLLDVPRALVEAYCAAAGLAPARDRSNAEAVYLRNRIRLALLPALEEGYNENIIEALVRLAASAAEDRAYFDEITDGLLKEGRATAEGAFEMPVALLAEAHPALRRRLIVRCFERVGLARDIAAVHLRAADALIAGGHTGKTVDFPGGYRLSLRYDRLRFFAADRPAAPAPLRERRLSLDDIRAGLAGEEEAGSGRDAGARARPMAGTQAAARAFTAEAGAYTLRFSLHSAARAAEGAARADASASEGAGCVALDFDRLAEAHADICVRGRRPGDFMRPAGMDGTKRIQDLFVDAKLPRGERDAVPLVAAGREILCVLAEGRLARRTGNYAVTAATERVLRIAYARRARACRPEEDGEKNT
ncbi:MAG: tRNA lysidine(34) synthetase TilS [Clostridiales Family XIII bacterium]|jgi:tRNA(Ile)-lysidine synthase|nr:tRNA lysidine(34) synthetase TilS [Clostridiales Family XIII bacterium]